MERAGERKEERQRHAVVASYLASIRGQRKRGTNMLRRLVTRNTGQGGEEEKRLEKQRRDGVNRERGGEGEEARRGSWFTCRHGNAASPLTCYSIGIARSSTVLSQLPEEYERESGSPSCGTEWDNASLFSSTDECAWIRTDLSLPLRRNRRILFLPDNVVCSGSKMKRNSQNRTIDNHSLSLCCCPLLLYYALYTVITEHALYHEI